MYGRPGRTRDALKGVIGSVKVEVVLTNVPARAVTLPNIGVPHYVGVPHRVTYPYGSPHLN